MSEFKKIVVKFFVAITCLSLLPILSCLLSQTRASASSPDYVTPTTAYAAIDFDYIGKRVKLPTEKIEVRASIRNDEKTQAKDVEIQFGFAKMGLSDDTDVKVACLSEEAYYWEWLEPGRGEYVSIDTAHYKNKGLDLFYENGSDEFKKLANPTTVDAYGERAHTILFGFQFSDLSDSIKKKWGTMYLYVYTGYNLELSEVGSGGAEIYYVTDGDYVAFSAVSVDDAERILYGEFGYFWKVTFPNTLNDLFDGCD